ncbi:intermembrane phospholipid transport protein YdbH family protein [Microbulbifer yueqingensis]|uniref:Dicarboxylate transport n=1 Tax=Microbulbifer yueqingensis TaxID=658219 RepID=A0A1G9E5H0_9GAMM|nr:YdbH domain-containing protein [Microbulbifer yueqingensis]SDK71352.1 Dicarboxylate transport [Microbulbifer yueqingensis]
MPRSRLIIPIVTCFLLAMAIGWAWVKRDTLATLIARGLVSEVEIERIQGFKVSPGQVRMTQLSVTLPSGTPVELRGVVISRPLDLVLRKQEGRTRVAIEAARLGDRPAPTTPDRPAPDIILSDLLQAVRFLPPRIEIAELVDIRSGGLPVRIKLQWDRPADTASIMVQGVGFELRGEASLPDISAATQRPVRLDLRLADGEGEDAFNLSATLRPGFTATTTGASPGHWGAALRMTGDVERLANTITLLPLPGAISSPVMRAGQNGNKTQSTGTFQLNVTGRIPDNLSHTEYYESLAARVESDELSLSLARLPGKLPLRITLATDGPVEFNLDSLHPLRVAAATGSANVLITRLQTSDQELFSGEIQARGGGKDSEITASGTLSLDTAALLLEDPGTALTALRALTGRGITDIGGRVELRGSATLPSLGRLGSDRLMTGLSLEILPGSRPEATLVKKENSPPALASVLDALGPGEARLQATFTKPLIIRARQWPGPLEVEASGLKLNLADRKGTQRLSSTLESLSCQLQQETACLVTVSARAPSIVLDKNASAADNQLVFAGSIATSNGEYRLASERFQASTEALTKNGLKAKGIRLESSGLSCSAPGKLHCEGDFNVTVISFSAPGLSGGGSAAMQGFELRREGGQTLASGGYATDDWTTRINDKYMIITEAQGDFTFRDLVLRGQSQVKAGHVTGESNWTHDFGKARGSAEISVAKAGFSQMKPLSDVISGLPVELVSGTLRGKGTFSWPARNSDRLQAQLRDVAAIYENTFAVGITGEAVLQRKGDSWYTPKPQAFSAKRVDVGVPVENIRFLLSVEQSGDVIFAGLDAELLGGSVHSDALTWNLAGEERRSQLSFSGLSLRALSDQMEAGNFNASGAIDMTIPLITDEEGVTVKSGKVTARPPGGRLRYYGAFSPEMLAGNPQLKMLAGALEDYSYRTLSGTLEYPPSGDMQMQLKLVGRSASLDQKRDLVINLNLENNIPAMLQSLQASRDLADALEKQLGNQ